MSFFQREKEKAAEIGPQLTRVGLSGGATLDVRDDLAISSQIYAVPADVATLRFGVAYRIR